MAHPAPGQRRVLVTGASGDVGLAVVERFLCKGAEVAAQGFHRTLGAQRPSPGAPGRLHPIRVDLSQEDGPRSLVAALPPAWDGLDVLVNAIGGARPATVEEITLSDWEHCLRINLTAPFRVLQAALPLLRRARGAVVNLASVAALTGGSFGPHYAATKAGIIGLTRSAARELGASGVRVNAVAPGPVRSRMTDSLPDGALDRIVSATALGRVVEPEEVADAVVWLAGGSAVTGQTLVVDGGRHLQ